MARLYLLLTAILLSAGLFLSAVAHAATAGPAASDPAVEERVAKIAEELRCLVCQNQTLADSNAPLAVDLKNEIRSMVAGGKSEADVVDFMVARYGDFVRYRPPFKATTMLLWVGPILLVAAALFLVLRRIRRLPPPQPRDLDASARARADALLGIHGEGR